MKIRVLFIFIPLISFGCNYSWAQGKEPNRSGKSNVQYEYKKFERIDFEALSIQGNVITPGDLSVKYKQRRKFKTRFPVREDFDEEIKNALNEI